MMGGDNMKIDKWLIGQVVVIILFRNRRKIAAKLISESGFEIMVENSAGCRTVLQKSDILKIRRPLKYLVDCEDPDENATNTAEIIQ